MLFRSPGQREKGAGGRARPRTGRLYRYVAAGPLQAPFADLPPRPYPCGLRAQASESGCGHAVSVLLMSSIFSLGAHLLRFRVFLVSWAISPILSLEPAVGLVAIAPLDRVAENAIFAPFGWMVFSRRCDVVVTAPAEPLSTAAGTVAAAPWGSAVPAICVPVLAERLCPALFAALIVPAAPLLAALTGLAVEDGTPRPDRKSVV